MNLLQLFKASLMEPKKQAAVRILGIGKIMQYAFAFIALLTIVSFVELVSGLGDTVSDVEGLMEFVKEIEWLLYPFALIFLFVSTTFYHFVKISFFAMLGVGLVRLKKKKGEYRHLWRTTALAVTIPTLISFVLSFFVSSLWISAATSLLTLVYLHLATNYYPKQPPPKNKPA